MDQHLQQLIKEDRITAQAAYEKAIGKKIFDEMIQKQEAGEGA